MGILFGDCSVGAPEIKQYFHTVAKKHDLNKFFKLNHRVIRAVWDEETSKWYITLRVNNDPTLDFEDSCDFFIKLVFLSSQTMCCTSPLLTSDVLN